MTEVATMTTWTIRADRRTAKFGVVAEELDDLAATLEGVSIQLVDRHSWDDAPDAGAFRDFHPIATVTGQRQALEYLAEELVAEFGYQVDFLR